MPSSDTYIEKDSSVNDEIDRLRHSATAALLTRRDTIVVASVSCIYGLGSPEEYQSQLLVARVGETKDQRAILRQLVDMQYERNDANLVRGKFRVRGDTIELHPAYDEHAVRISLFGDDIEQIVTFDPLTGEKYEDLDELVVFPASHYVASDERLKQRSGAHRSRAARAPRVVRVAGQAARGPASAHAHAIRPRDDPRGRLLQRHRELLGPHRRPGSGRGALHVDRLFPRRLLGGHRRVARRRAPVARAVRGRSFAQGDLGRSRLPVAFGRRQPPVALRRVRRPRRSGRVLERHAERLRAPGVVACRRADRATDRAGRSRGHDPADQGTDRRSHRRHQPDRRARRAGARHDADQEDGRRPHRLPARDGVAGALPPLQRRHHPAHRDPARSPSRRVRRVWSVSTCCERVSTFPRCRSWPSSTPTKRASCAAARR